MAEEREFKFAVPREWELPSLDGAVLVDPVRTIEQTATYYDTPDLRLTRAGASMRFRDDDGWTVKLPAVDEGVAALVRGEHVFGGRPGVPPAEALGLLTARVRGARLAPVARLRTTRRCAVLRSATSSDGVAAGQELGALTDDLVTVLEGRATGTFREVEVELAPDVPPGALDAVAARLRDSGASDAEPAPKVARALGPGAAAPPDVVTFAVGSPPTVEAVVRHAFSDAVGKLVTSDPVVRIGDDVEGVHQARVATRRLRSHLRTFRRLLDPEWAQWLRDELGWLGDELGAVRDTDVLLHRLGERIATLDEPDRAVARPILDHLEAEQRAARAVLLDGMSSARYVALLERLVEAANRPRVVTWVGDDDDVLRGLARRPWRALRDAVAALPDPAPDPDLHAVRIRAKRARYAAEVLEPAFGKPARDFARALTRVQDVLGEHQDAVVAADWLRRTALGLGDAPAIYAAGELGAAERAAAEASRAEWPSAWRAASKRRLRRWL